MLSVERLSYQYVFREDSSPAQERPAISFVHTGLHCLSFHLAPQERLAICAPSGAGKTTLLKLIAGLLPLQSGRICWQGQDISALSAHLRGFALVFQEHALFDHLDVFGNVAFAPRMQGLPKSVITKRVQHSLAALELEHYAKRRVWQLSGGQQQRVALARALAAAPKLLLLDEPFANLDPTLRARARKHVQQVLELLQAPCILVSHDACDIAELCQRTLDLASSSDTAKALSPHARHLHPPQF